MFDRNPFMCIIKLTPNQFRSFFINVTSTKGGDKMIKTAPVESSMISQIGHDPDNRTLRVKFKNGDEWDYADVSQEEAEELLTSKSKGSHFHKHIKKVKVGQRVS